MATFTERTIKGTKYYRLRFVDVLGNKKEFTGRGKKELTQKMKDWNKSIVMRGGVVQANKVYTVSEWTLTHLLINKYKNIADSTFEGYMAIYRNYIEYSSLGNMKLDQVTHMDVQTFLNQHRDKAYSTLKKYYLLLLQAFESALKNKLVLNNPVKDVIIPNKDVDPKPIDVLTEDQQRKYIRALQGELHENLYLTLLFTGMRLGEALALRWSDIDFNTRTININHSVRRVRTYDDKGNPAESKMLLTPPKRKSARPVPLPSFLYDRLLPLRPKDVNRYVFPTTTGNIQTARNVRKYHDRICENAGLPKFGLHALRHTYVTRLLESGENPKTIQDLVGHKDIETTLNIYAHVLESTKKASAEKQDALFNKLC